jgi:hypothetical protein
VDRVWDRDLSRIRDLVREAPRGAALDPRVVAETVRLPLGATIALLQALAGSREGRLELRVVDARGLEVASYPSLPDVPSAITNEFGDRIAIGPENVELIFRVAR